MKHFWAALATAGLMTITASAGIFDYNTIGTTIICGPLVGCVQNGNSSVIVGGVVTLTYSPVPTTVVNSAGAIGLGSLTASLASSTAFTSLSGIILTLNLSALSQGSSGTITNGTITGGTSGTLSSASLAFAVNNTATLACPSCPGVGLGAATYQVKPSGFPLPNPIAGGASNLSTVLITGIVSSAIPEPASLLLLSLGLGAIALIRRLAQP